MCLRTTSTSSCDIPRAVSRGRVQQPLAPHLGPSAAHGGPGLLAPSRPEVRRVTVPTVSNTSGIDSPDVNRRGALLLRDEPRSLATGLLVSLAAVAVTTALIYPLRQITPAVSNGVVYMLAVLVISTYWGLGPGLFTAVSSALTFNFFHIPPTGRITIADPQNYVALGVFLAAAILASTVANLARARANEAERRREEADLAADLAWLLLGGADPPLSTPPRNLRASRYRCRAPSQSMCQKRRPRPRRQGTVLDACGTLRRRSPTPHSIASAPSRLGPWPAPEQLPSAPVRHQDGKATRRRSDPSDRNRLRTPGAQSPRSPATSSAQYLVRQNAPPTAPQRPVGRPLCSLRLRQTGP
jgi:hypothetical protein